MLDLDSILNKFKNEFETALAAQTKHYINCNAIALQVYNDTRAANKRRYDSIVKEYTDEYNFIVKNINALYDCYVVTSNQLKLQYNSSLQKTLNNFPDLSKLSFNGSYTKEQCMDRSTLFKIVKFNKSDACKKFPYSKITYNTFINRVYDEWLIKCIAEPIDIMLCYEDNNCVAFYRLSTGTKIYVYVFDVCLTPYSLPMFRYYNNSIIIVIHKYCSINETYLIAIEFDITPDFIVTKKEVKIYTTHSEPGQMHTLCNLVQNGQYNITFSTTTSDIYCLKDTMLHIIKCTPTYKYYIIDLTKTLADSDVKKLKTEFSSPRKTLFEVISITNSNIKLYARYYADGSTHRIEAEYIYDFKLDAATYFRNCIINVSEN